LELWCDRRRAAELFSGNGAGEAAAAAAVCTDGGRRERARATEWRERLGTRGGVLTRWEGVVGRGAPNAGVRPPCGCRGMGQGGRRTREREGRGRQAGLLAGPKGRRVGPAAPVPFSFFLKFFSQALSKFI